MRILLLVVMAHRYRNDDIEIGASTCDRRLKSKIVCGMSDSCPVLTVGSKSGDKRVIRDSVEMLSSWSALQTEPAPCESAISFTGRYRECSMAARGAHKVRPSPEVVIGRWRT